MMHKKALHIILSLVLLVSTTGVTFSMHYCGGQYVSTSLFVEADSCCGDACGCCENKNVHYEVDDDYTSPVVSVIDPSIELDLLIELFYFEIDAIELSTQPVKKTFEDTSPPLPIAERLSLLQSFLC